jgi:hypothetical protein
MAAVPLSPGIIHTDMLDICFGEDAGKLPVSQSMGAKSSSFFTELETFR